VKRLGYGLLGLKPDELFSLTFPEYLDMVDAKTEYDLLNQDREYERTAWSTSMIMSASGNYGKKGIDPKKLYERQLDERGRPLKDNTESHGAFTPIDKTEKDNKLNELMKKFNK
jgi:hypothetical protein